MKIFRNIILGIVLINLSACGQAGWVGYYSIKKPDGSENKIDYNTDNGVVMDFPKHQEMWLEMPRDCSGFTFAGFFTPFTPPFPIPNFRTISFGKNNPCNYFTISTRPEAVSVQLTTNSQTFTTETTEGSYGYTKYKFPIKANKIDSGTIIIEKDGEKIEVPFEYKYFKFWY